MSGNPAGPQGGDFRLQGAARAERLRAAHAEVFHAVDEVLVLEDGYAFRLPPDDATARRALDFVLAERSCCPFLAFELTFEPEGRGLWLTLGGGPGAGAFLDAEQLPSAGLGLESCGCGCGCCEAGDACSVEFGDAETARATLESTDDP